MKKILFSLMFLFLIFSIVGVQAISPISPTNVSLSCGDYTFLDITGIESSLTSLNITDTTWSKPGLNVGMGFDFKQLNTIGGNTLKTYFFTDTINCQQGPTYTIFNIGNTDYRINIEVLKKEYSLGEKLISVNEALKIGQDIGQDISFGVLGISEGSVHYILKGCMSVSEEDTMTNQISKECSGNIDLRIKILTTIPELGVAKFEVFSSEPSFVLTKSNETVDGDSSECKLGLDTLGAKVKRGNILGANMINLINKEIIPSIVIVTIIDPDGELTPISASSDDIGYFSKRLHEDYKEEFITVQLRLPPDSNYVCKSNTVNVPFDEPYSDYIKAKQQEEGTTNLVLNMSARYELKAISGTIKNALNEVVEGVEVRITNPDNSVIIVQSNVNGLFTWTPVVVGVYKLQGGKDNYQSTDLVSIEVYQNKQYLIVIKVNGESKSTYKKNDRLSFELRNENNTLIPLSIENATFAGLPLRFIAGISDEVIFEGTSGTLNIPAVEGYITQSLTLTAKKNNWSGILMTIGIIIGIIVVLILVVAIVRKFKGREKPDRKMEIQLGEGG